ncbi:BatA domain-containing protein [uncultured Polaribacter sp.]|uniref:BatA domain-containing protein n=1 Tax=uncultured Polaribacter sp. TaxID=174711 RepID=UPI00262000ED|nr:BatA domain-containing protein [uncultured Polaribacter sp.]
MQFKNPEVLYFLALLIIPILVHLFQLQKFVKVPFTNVAFLQKIIQENRKSSRIKKWLILATRMFLFFAILFAFSQPYFSNKKDNKKQHTFIYLDNSLSTNTKGEKGDLLQIAAQEIIQNASKKDEYSLQTNSNFHEKISYNELKKELLKIKKTSKKLELSTLLLKIKSKNTNKTNTLSKNILISDFQNKNNRKFTNVTPSFSAIKLKSSTKNNISIDSVFLDNSISDNTGINIIIKNQGEEKKNISIGIFNNEELISKQSFSIDKDTQKTIPFTIQKQTSFLGKIKVSYSDTFLFDNDFYFNINSIKKINILCIGNKAKFLSKIYNKEEFNFTQTSVQNVNYNSILKQQLIILNELESLPETLSKSILDFTNKGGNIVIIQSENSSTDSYNSFFNKIGNIKIDPIIKDTLKITNINYNHPLFKNVFSKKVNNFQYPIVQSHYTLSAKNKSNIVTFENNSSFISQIKTTSNSNLYFIASSLHRNSSNFLNSPLIVPVFYNFGKLSFQHSKLYYYLDQENKIDIETKLDKDEILNLSNSSFSFIPIQQTHQNKVSITTKENPIEAGFYHIIKEKDTLQTIAFNHPKEESLLQYLDLNELKNQHKNMTISNSIKDVFTEINNKNEVHWLWKWFLGLAIVSLLLEILILKFYKP